VIPLARTAFWWLLLSWATAPSVLAQQTETSREAAEARPLPDPRDPAAVGFQYDPRELYPEGSGAHPTWKRILGPVGVGGFHVFPGRVAGPNNGPPRTIWGQGIGTSLWRDPITGWPLQ
jgi:hypothetical protein